MEKHSEKNEEMLVSSQGLFQDACAIIEQA